MNKSKLPILLALLISTQAARASAQALELGAGVGAVRVTDGGDFWFRSMLGPAVDAKVGFAFTDRFAVESFFTYGRRSIPVSEFGPVVSGGDTQITEGLYGVVVRQRIVGKPNGFRAFVTYGLGGGYSRQSAPARQYLYGRTVVTQPAYTSSETEGLWFPIGGFGVQQAIGNRLAVRAEGQVVTFFGIPIGGRGSVGVVVPIGRSVSPSRRQVM